MFFDTFAPSWWKHNKTNGFLILLLRLEYKEPIQWTNTRNQYNEPIQWTNTMNQYKESVQWTNTMHQYNEPMNAWANAHMNPWTNEPIWTHIHSLHIRWLSKTGLESHYIDLPLWIPNPPSVRVCLLGYFLMFSSALLYIYICIYKWINK